MLIQKCEAIKFLLTLTGISGKIATDAIYNVKLIATRRDRSVCQSREGRNDSSCTIVSLWMMRLRVNEHEGPEDGGCKLDCLFEWTVVLTRTRNAQLVEDVAELRYTGEQSVAEFSSVSEKKDRGKRENVQERVSVINEI